MAGPWLTVCPPAWPKSSHPPKPSRSAKTAAPPISAERGSGEIPRGNPRVSPSAGPVNGPDRVARALAVARRRRPWVRAPLEPARLRAPASSAAPAGTRSPRSRSAGSHPGADATRSSWACWLRPGDIFSAPGTRPPRTSAPARSPEPAGMSPSPTAPASQAPAIGSDTGAGSPDALPAAGTPVPIRSVIRSVPSRSVPSRSAPSRVPSGRSHPPGLAGSPPTAGWMPGPTPGPPVSSRIDRGQSTPATERSSAAGRAAVLRGRESNEKAPVDSTTMPSVAGSAVAGAAVDPADPVGRGADGCHAWAASSQT